MAEFLDKFCRHLIREEALQYNFWKMFVYLWWLRQKYDTLKDVEKLTKKYVHQRRNMIILN